jgi:uncharacterized protein (TIGR03435 family)
MLTTGLLASALRSRLGTGHVVDKTGLTDQYDFKLEHSSVGLSGPQPAAVANDSASDPVPDLFTALEKQHGLKTTG